MEKCKKMFLAGTVMLTNLHSGLNTQSNKEKEKLAVIREEIRWRLRKKTRTCDVLVVEQNRQ